MWPTSRKGIIAMNRKTRNLLALQASKFRSFRSKLWWEVELTKIYRRCRIFLLSGELEMRILWDSWCHAHACKMPREIINCPLYPAGLGDTTESLYFFLLLCITIRSRSLFSAKQTRGGKSRWNENGWIKLCFLVFLQFTWHVYFFN